MAEENEKPVVAPPVFAFEKNKAHKRTAEDSSPEDGEDSDKDDGRICSAAKRGRKAPFTNFPPTHSVSKNNVFMPSSFCQSPSGNSDSEPEEKPVGFRLKPPILIHGQAPSAGVPCPKPKEAQRSILRPPLLQPPPARMTSDTHTSNSSSNGVESPGGEPNCGIMLKTFAPDLQNNVLLMKETEDNRKQKNADVLEGRCGSSDASFVFGENVKDRVEIDQCESSERGDCVSKDKSEETNYFLQYINTSSPQKNDNPDNRATFVFGKNMMDRVVALPKEPEGVSIESQAESGLLNKPLITSSSPEQASDNYENKKESLEESAARHESHRAQKCLLDRVEVRTGEEAERNVLQMLCKLFVFEPTSQSWLERGCGVLRLNDMASTDDGAFQSRLVMRTQGSLRVILNTKLWPQMQVDKASEKSLRVTAMDTEEQGVKVFLISSSSKDAAQLFVALHHRILALRSISGQECDDHPDRETMGFSDDDESRTPPITAAPLPGDSEEAVCSSIGDV